MSLTRAKKEESHTQIEREQYFFLGVSNV